MTVFQVILAIISVGFLGVIINYAVSSKSSRFLKLAAMLALGLIVLSLGVASIILATGVFRQNKTNEEAHLPIFLNAPAPPSNRGNIVQIVIFLVFFALILGVLSVIAYRDHKQKQNEVTKVDHSKIFPDGAEDLKEKTEEPSDKPKSDDDPFSLNLN